MNQIEANLSTQNEDNQNTKTESSNYNDNPEDNTKIKIEQIEEINLKHQFDDEKEKDFFNNEQNSNDSDRKPTHEEDLLQIPAFLRRQAN